MRIAAGGGSLLVETAGEGHPILFLGGSLHDLAHDRAGFRLAALGRVAIPDQLGLGGTVPPAPPPWSMADYAADALAVADGLGWARFDLVGYSFGAMVAQHLAAGSDRVRRLALIAAGPGGPLASAPLHAFWPLPRAARARAMLSVQDTRVPDPSDAAVAAFAERLDAKLARAPEGGPAALLAARAEHDARAVLGRIAAPTLVVGGRHDGQAPPAIVKALARAIPGARLAMIDGGHAFLGDDPGPLGVVEEAWRAA